MQLRVCKLEKFAPKVGKFCNKGFGFVRLNGRLEMATWFLLQSSKDMFICISACVCEESWGSWYCNKGGVRMLFGG